MSLKNSLFIFLILSLFSCETENNTDGIKRIEIIYEPVNQELMDGVLWYDRIVAFSTVELSGKTYYISGQDTSLCKIDIGYLAEWKKIPEKRGYYEMLVRNNKNHISLIKYFTENSKKYADFHFLVKSEKYGDIILNWIDSSRTSLYYYVNHSRVDPAIDSLELETIEYMHY